MHFQTDRCTISKKIVRYYKNFKLFYCLYLALAATPKQTSGLFRMTNLHCESFNKSWVVINNCRLRAVRRGVTTFNMNITILHPAYEIDINEALVKRASGYKPFGFNTTIDACAFIKKPNNPIGILVFKLFRDFSNINHTCPYVGDQILDGFYLREDMFKLPLPDAEYGLIMTWYLHKQKVFVTNVYFEFRSKSN